MEVDIGAAKCDVSVLLILLGFGNRYESLRPCVWRVCA